MRAADKTAPDAGYQKTMNTPMTAGDVALFSGFMLAMIALGVIGLGRPAWGQWRWRGGWRFAAVLPSVDMPFEVPRIVIDTAAHGALAGTRRRFADREAVQRHETPPCGGAEFELRRVALPGDRRCAPRGWRCVPATSCVCISVTPTISATMPALPSDLLHAHPAFSSHRHP